MNKSACWHFIQIMKLSGWVSLWAKTAADYLRWSLRKNFLLEILLQITVLIYHLCLILAFKGLEAHCCRYSLSSFIPIPGFISPFFNSKLSSVFLHICFSSYLPWSVLLSCLCTNLVRQLAYCRCLQYFEYSITILKCCCLVWPTCSYSIL